MTTFVRRRKPTPTPAGNEVVMGIDQSYSGFGVCILRPDGTHTSHRASFDPATFGKGVDRLNDIGVWLRALVYNTTQQVAHICMEGYAPGAKFGREMSGELGAIVKTSLRLHPRLWDPASYPTIVSPGQLKQFGTGKATAKKEDVKLGVYKKWGVEFATNDDADAYVLARIAGSLHWRTDELTGYQSTVLAKLHPHTERPAMP